VDEMRSTFANWRTANEFGERVSKEYEGLESVLHKELLEAQDTETVMSINDALDRLLAAFQQVSYQVNEAVALERQVREDSPEFYEKAREAALRAQEAEARAAERREGFGT